MSSACRTRDTCCLVAYCSRPPPFSRSPTHTRENSRTARCEPYPSLRTAAWCRNTLTGGRGIRLNAGEEKPPKPAADVAHSSHARRISAQSWPSASNRVNRACQAELAALYASRFAGPADVRYISNGRCACFSKDRSSFRPYRYVASLETEQELAFEVPDSR